MVVLRGVLKPSKSEELVRVVKAAFPSNFSFAEATLEYNKMSFVMLASSCNVINYFMGLSAVASILAKILPRRMFGSLRLDKL